MEMHTKRKSFVYILLGSLFLISYCIVLKDTADSFQRYLFAPGILWALLFLKDGIKLRFGEGTTLETLWKIGVGGLVPLVIILGALSASSGTLVFSYNLMWTLCPYLLASVYFVASAFWIRPLHAAWSLSMWRVVPAILIFTSIPFLQNINFGAMLIFGVLLPTFIIHGVVVATTVAYLKRESNDRLLNPDFVLFLIATLFCFSYAFMLFLPDSVTRFFRLLF